MRIDRIASVVRRDGRRRGAPGLRSCRARRRISTGQVAVRPLVRARRRCRPRPIAPFAQHRVERRAVILDVDPVAHVAAVAVERQRLVGERVGDEERDQLLGELVRAVVVRAARDDDVEPVRVRAYASTSRSAAALLAAYGLFGRSGRPRWRVPRCRGCRRPRRSRPGGSAPRRARARRRAGLCVPTTLVRRNGACVRDRAVDVRLGGEVHDRVDAVLERRRDGGGIGDVARARSDGAGRRAAARGWRGCRRR